MLHHVSGISSLCLFVNLILVPVPPFPTQLFLHPSLLPLLIQHSAYQLLPLFFTTGLKPTCFTLYPRSFTSSSRTANSRSIAWTDSSKLLVFSLLFVFVPCARLSCPTRSSAFESALIYTSYRRKMVTN